MLTSLDFLQKGMEWLPRDEDTISRMFRYDRNYKLFNKRNEELESYKESFKRIERVIGNFQDVISYASIINYFRLITKKTGDLLLGEKPLIQVENRDNFEELSQETKLYLKLYKSAIDISRYGDSILYVYKNDSGKGDFKVISPKLWIPVVDFLDHSEIIYHVLAWEFKTGNEYFLNVEIHDVGKVEKRVYKLETRLDNQIKINTSSFGKFIGDMISSEVFVTDLEDFAIIPLSNFSTTDSVTGIDDYCDIDDIVQELLVRIAQVSKVLDRHASPSVSGPSSALEKDPVSGMWKLKMDRYFPRDSTEDPEIKYITWDGALEPSFNQIQLLINQLYVVSEMGSILLGGEDVGGNSVSGRALKFRMISAVSKVKRISMYIDSDVRRLIKNISALGYEKIDNISITWQDGIPNDSLEEAEIIEKRTGGAVTMSQKRVLMQYDQLHEEEAEKELEQIKNEEVEDNPLSAAPFSEVQPPLGDDE